MGRVLPDIIDLFENYQLYLGEMPDAHGPGHMKMNRRIIQKAYEIGDTLHYAGRIK